MPKYTVTDPFSGRSVTLEGDSPPSEVEIEQVFNSLPTAPTGAQTRPAEQSKPVVAEQQSPLEQYMSIGQSKQPIEQREPQMPSLGSMLGPEQISPEIAKNIVSILKEAGPTAVANVPPAIANYVGGLAGPWTSSAAGAAVAYPSSLASQLMQGRSPGELSQKEAAANALAYAIPYFGPEAGLSKTAAIALNAGLATAGSEGVRAIEKGGFEAPKGVLEFAGRLTPGAVSSAATMAGFTGKKLSDVAKVKSEVSAERFGGSVLLSELFPEYSKLEALQLSEGNKKVVDLVKNMDVNISDAVNIAFKDVPNASKVANALAPHIDELGKLEKAALSSKANAETLASQAVAAEQQGRIIASQLKKEARQSALIAYADKAAYEGMLNKTFGGGVPSLSNVSEGARITRLKESVGAAKLARKQITDDLYDAAGVTINTPVVSFSDVASSANKYIKGDKAKADFLAQMESIFDGNETITREVFLDAKNKIADNLAVAGSLRSDAERKAGEFYGTLKKASDDFVKREMPESYRNYTYANESFAKAMNAEKANAIDLAANGKADDLFGLIKSQGSGPVLSEIDSYASALKQIGGEDAAIRFKSDIMAGLRDSILDASSIRTTGYVSASKVFDPVQIAKQLSELSTKRFPIEQLGLGSLNEIRSLAKISTIGKRGGLRADELSAFMDELPNVGIDKAVARLEYNKTLREHLVSGGYFTNRTKVLERQQLAKKAGIDAAYAEKALLDANNDPIVSLLNQTDLGISRDAAKNSNWASNLLSMDKEYISKFTYAMSKKGMAAQTDEIGKAAAKSVMMQFEQMAFGGPASLKSGNIVDFFTNPQNADKVDNLKALMGNEQFNNLKKIFVNPLERINRASEIVGMKPGAESRAVQTALFVKSVAERKASAQVILSNAISRAKKYAQEKQYNMLHLLYIDPKWAGKFAATGYNVNKFIDQSPVNAVAIKLAQQSDAEEAQKSPQ